MRFLIDEFAEMVHPRDGHPKIFAMIDAYLDETGIHDGAAMCAIAGYFGGRGQWRRFERAWKKVLDDFDVPMEKFHAKNLFPKPTGFFQHHWDTSRHESFLNALARTIAAHQKITPLGFGIVVADFFTFAEGARQFFTGATVNMGKLIGGCPNKPYFVPFQRCITRVCDYAPVGGKAHFFFGLDRPFAEYATALFQQIKVSSRYESLRNTLGDPSFPLAKQTPQLQAADLLACLLYHHLLKGRSNLMAQAQSPWLRLCAQNRRSENDFEFVDKHILQNTLIMGMDISRHLSRQGQSST